MVPVSHINGGEWNGKTSQYFIPQSDTNKYQSGDVVTTAYGTVDSVSQYYPAGLSQVTKVVSSRPNPRGVMTSVAPLLLNIDVQGVPASKTTGYVINVVDDPLVVFRIQCDNTTTLTPAILGKYADFNLATGPANTSGTQLASATISTDGSLPLRILGLVDGDHSAYCDLLVCFNIHELG